MKDKKILYIDALRRHIKTVRQCNALIEENLHLLDILRRIAYRYPYIIGECTSDEDIRKLKRTL